MNRKKIKVLITRGLAIACIASLTIGNGKEITIARALTENKISSEVLTGEGRVGTILLQEDFSTTKVENDSTYKNWWENEVRPSQWQLRKWNGATATGSNTPYGRVIEDSLKDGGKYVEVSCNNSVGFFQPDSFINISKGVDYKLKFKMKTDGVTATDPIAVRVEYYSESNAVLERKDVKKLSGTNDWDEYEVIIGTTTDATKMKVIFIFGNVSASSTGATGSFSVDSLSVNADGEKLEKIDFDSSVVNLGLGSVYKPKGAIYPSHSKEQYTLISSDENIAKITDGVIYAEGIGSTVITATSESGKVLGEFTVKVGEDKTVEYNKALDSIFETMVPNSIIDLNDEQTVNTINTQVENGRKQWEAMNKSQDRLGLWSDTTSTTNSAHITTQYNRLYDMAVAYSINGSDLKGNDALLNDIKDGLKWLKDNRYDGNKFYNNWWDWEIGAPQKLNGILAMLRSEFTDLEIIEYTDIIDAYVKDPTMHTQGRYPAVGANRADMCKVVIYSGLLSKNEDRINLGISKLDPLFKYVEEIIEEEGQKVDGYYKDGSWVEHGSIPYAGSYGAVLIDGVGEMAHILNDTPWAIDEDKLNKIYQVIIDSFEPLIYKGVMMNMVSGRAISRANERDYGHGFGVMRRILAFYTESAPEEYRDRYKAMIKQWIESNDKRDIIGNSTNLQFTVQAKALMKDNNVAARGELIGNYIYPNMDRVVHRRPGYVFGLSMYSSRIANYESLNGENLKGYHTSDGMTYLYNGDIGQYSNDFWPTVDSKRLPGTTVDTKNIFENVVGKSYGPGETATSMQDWVGGASLGDYGVSGMYLDNKRSNPNKDLGMDLEAKKSYFMFDNEIVALGAGVNSTKDNGVETIIENRLINKTSDKIYINGENVSESIDTEVKVDNVKWAYLEGEDVNSSIGYYLPKESSINVKRDTRTGSWKEINNGQSATPITNTFFTMWKDHGTNPTNDTYEYVLLPNISKEDTASYAESSEIEILVNNEDVQAVRENSKNIFAANFWNDKEVEVDGIKVNKKASLIMQKQNEILSISVSDPTMKNSDVITIELDEKLHEVISSDENIKVIENGDSIILEVNVDKSSGQSLKAELKLVVEDDNTEGNTEDDNTEGNTEDDKTEGNTEDDKTEDNTEDNNQGGNNTNTPGEVDNDKDLEEADKGENGKGETINNSVNTSDVSSLGLMGSLLALSAGGLFIFRKKK